MQKVIIILFILFSVFPFWKINAENYNVGFIPANIWYSQDPFEEGDKIKIYTLIFNPDSRELSGTVNFFDKTVLLGKKNFTVPAKGVKDVSIDWTATIGSHTIFGKIENAKFLISNGEYQEIYLEEDETEKSSRTVSKKIISEKENTNLEEKENDTNSIQNISNIVKEKTPDFIAKPINSAVNALEEFREENIISSEQKKEEVEKEIEFIENQEIKLQKEKEENLINNLDKKTDIEKDPKVQKNQILKPFKHAEIFFLNIYSTILKNKILFYSVLAVISFFVLRFIFRLIF